MNCTKMEIKVEVKLEEPSAGASTSRIEVPKYDSDDSVDDTIEISTLRNAENSFIVNIDSDSPEEDDDDCVQHATSRREGLRKRIPGSTFIKVISEISIPIRLINSYSNRKKSIAMILMK